MYERPFVVGETPSCRNSKSNFTAKETSYYNLNGHSPSSNQHVINAREDVLRLPDKSWCSSLCQDLECQSEHLQNVEWIM